MLSELLRISATRSANNAHTKKEKWGWARHFLRAAVHAHRCNYAGIPQPSQAVGRQSPSETLLYSAHCNQTLQYCVYTRPAGWPGTQWRYYFQVKADGKLSVRMNKRRTFSEKPVIQGYTRCWRRDPTLPHSAKGPAIDALNGGQVVPGGWRHPRLVEYRDSE